MADLSTYKVGEILSVEECGMSKGKPLRCCKISVGDANNPLTVVTLANVGPGSRVAVAPVGSTVITSQGEDLEIKETSVGGRKSQGMICDSAMLGWSGGGVGSAAKMPGTLELGSAPPSSKPRPKQGDTEIPASEVKGLFEKKLTKEEKKTLAAERKAKRKAAKEEADAGS